MSDTSRYDLGVIGAGSAAYAAAIRARALGARVALIERGTVGGTCVNVGCIPSKHLLAASDAYRAAGEHPFRGVETGQMGVDLSALIATKTEVVEEIREEKYIDLAERVGFEIIRGHASFVAPDQLDVDSRRIRARRIVIATGSTPWAPPIAGLDEAGYLTSTGAMELTAMPESLVVIGGNYIGLELGQVFANLGSKVTIVEALDRIAPLEEPEISEGMTQILQDQGVRVVISANVTRIETGSPKTVVAETSGDVLRLPGEEILVATGRRPVLDGLELENAGVELDDRGALVVDGTLRTTNPIIFAAGDVTGAPQFVYVAAAQGTLAAENAIEDAGRQMDYTALPRVTFTAPNIAAVGLTEEQAAAAGYPCECRVLELRHVPRARVNLDTRGLVKIVAERSTGRVLGIHLLAENAGDVILAGVYAVRFGLTVGDLADNWAPYLTMSEAVKLAAQAFDRDVSMLSCCAA
ncbi:MAG TPA: mercury(II) reductase [Actinomycetota bacterium]